MAACSVDKCPRPRMARGMCQTHYVRVKRTGSPTGSTMPALVASYDAVHARLRRNRGRAADLTCRCGSPARTWAYDHSDPKELAEVRAGYRVPFSMDLDRYEPLCQSCHSQQDHRASHGAPYRERVLTWGQYRCGATRTKNRGICAVIVLVEGSRCGKHKEGI